MTEIFLQLMKLRIPVERKDYHYLYTIQEMNYIQFFSKFIRFRSILERKEYTYFNLGETLLSVKRVW